MPELPEVEVTKMGISPALLHATVTDVFIGEKSLRVPLSQDLVLLKGHKVTDIARRGKYIVISFDDTSSIIVHLGMTGHFKVQDANAPFILHDHFRMYLDNGQSITLNDARRFGLVIYIRAGDNPYENKFLKVLGVEPFSDNFNATYLLNKFKNKSIAIKVAIMDSHIVVGVGNIYASESLFLSGIDPTTKSCDVKKEQLEKLVDIIKDLLKKSIAMGGTTIRDFSGADGKPGYFVQNLFVYGHEGEPCKVCNTPIVAIEQGQRRTYFCPHCQK